MTDANSNNSFNPDELASKLIQELSALGVQTNPDVELRLRTQIASSANPIETYTTIRADMLRQLNIALGQEAQIQTVINVVLGVIVLGILGLISQCASFVQKITAPPMDAAVYQRCIEAYGSSYQHYCTKEAQNTYQEQNK